jgi:hypothetical protein
MDRETKRAYQLVQATIVENLDRLQAAQKNKIKLPSGDVNDLKKWRRFGAAFAWDPTVFQDVLEKPYMEPEDLIKKLRKTEEGLMRDFQYVKGIPLHHIIADRTGGDLGIRTPIDIWEDTKKRIFDLTGATPGDNQANLNAIGAFDELWHQGRLGAKNTVFAEAGLIRPEDFPYLHRAGQNLADKLGLNPKLVQASAEEQVKALLPSILQQQERFAETSATPQVQKQRNVFVQAGFPEILDPTTSAERIGVIEKATRKTPLPLIFAKAGSMLYDGEAAVKEFMASDQATIMRGEVNKGLAKLGLPPMQGSQMFNVDPVGAAISGAIDYIRKNPIGASIGAATSIEPEAVKSLFQGKPKEALVQTLGGAVSGALVEQGGRLAAPLLSKIPGAAAAGSVLGPAAGAVGGYQLADAILEGATGEGYVGTLQQVQDKERTARINQQMQESAEISRQQAIAQGKPDPMRSSDFIEKVVTDPLNELEYAGKQVLGGLKAVGGAILFGF